MNKAQPALALGGFRGGENGIPMPAISSALAYYDGYRCARLPANLLQAQRDYFGAHTYERTDKPRGQFFHTNWTGRGGTTASPSRLRKQGKLGGHALSPRPRAARFSTGPGAVAAGPRARSPAQARAAGRR
jgi:hypothetical protein